MTTEDSATVPTQDPTNAGEELAESKGKGKGKAVEAEEPTESMDDDDDDDEDEEEVILPVTLGTISLELEGMIANNAFTGRRGW
jgi:hypothetical protein